MANMKVLSCIVLSLAVGFLCYHVHAAPEQSFDDWLVNMRVRALKAGISEETVNRALTGLKPDSRVIAFDRKQPEFVQTFEQYLASRVTGSRIREARAYYRQYADTLKAIAADYDVDPQYLVAFWGLESSFGRHQGRYHVVRSLATLAWDPRRSEFFSRELIKALEILDQGHVPLDQFVGGWAGAMGQNQFMPSSFLKYAQDYDGDGRKNIWSSREDVWASIANFLGRNGWVPGAGWGFVATTGPGFDRSRLEPAKGGTGCLALHRQTPERSWSEWQKMGVDIVGEKTPDADRRLAMVIPEVGAKKVYLVGGNFRTILSYNCANKYAVSVGLLADEIVKPVK